MIYFILSLFLCSTVYAMDVDLGKVDITKNQQSHLSEIKDTRINGICVWENGRVVAVTEKDLNENDKSEILNSIKALPDVEKPKEKSLEDRIKDLEKKNGK